MAEQQIDVQWSPGKARAFDTWLNQGRGIKRQRNMGRREVYRSGPMKGKTYDEARMGFERMWSTVDPAIRQKYEREAMGPDARTATEMPAGNPSSGDRRGNAELNASRPGETYSQTVARQQAARAGKTVAMEPWQGGQAVGSGEQATAQQGRSFDELTADPSVFSADGMQHSVGSGEPSTPIKNEAPLNMGGSAIVIADYMRRRGEEEARNRGYGSELDARDEAERRREAENQAQREAARQQKEEEQVRRSAGLPPTPPTAAPAPNREANIAAAQDPDDLPTDDRMAAARIAQPAQPAQPATPALPPVPLRTGGGGRIAQTPEGMELVGMKSGTPQYAPIGEVYAGRTGDAPGPGGVGPVREMRPDADIRADYQRRMQPPPATAVQKPQAFPQGPASQAPKPYQSPPAGPDLYTPGRQRDEARQARDAGTQGDYFRAQGNEQMAKMFPNATANPPGLVASGPYKPLDQLPTAPLALPIDPRDFPNGIPRQPSQNQEASRGTSAQSPYSGAPPRKRSTAVRPMFSLASRR